MANQITQLSDKGYIVNGKAVYQSESGKWVREVKFEWFEITLFKNYLKAIQNGVKVKFKNCE